MLVGKKVSPYAPYFFRGQIDEVVIFDRVLSEDEIEALGNSPWSDVTLASTSDSHTSWSYALTHELEGLYKAGLFTTDALGNGGVVNEAWTGVIDTMSPRLSLTYIDNGGNSSQVSCMAKDDFLSETGWSCPITAASLITSTQDANWWTTNITSTGPLVQISAYDGAAPVVSNPTMTACDQFGNCHTDSAGAPVLATIPAQFVHQGETLNFTAVANDANNDSLTFSLSHEPAGASIDGISGQFTWTPGTNVTGGVYTPTVIVSDGTYSDTQIVNITVYDQNPILRLSFDEAAGETTFSDSSWSNYPVSCYVGQCPTAGEPGVSGNAVEFDGIDDALVIPHVLDPSTSDLTAALWLKIDPAVSDAPLFVHANGSGKGLKWLYLNWPSHWNSELYNGSNWSGVRVTQDEWIHIAVTKKGQTVKFYIDGQLDYIPLDSPSSIPSNIGEMLIGSSQTSKEKFRGLIDEVVIYPRVLSDTEIATLATQSNSDAADRVPTNLPIDEEPEGEVITTLFLPVFSNQSPFNARAANGVSSQSTTEKSVADDVSKGTTNIFLPIISNQAGSQVGSSSAQNAPVAIPVEKLVHKVMLPVMMNQ
ncbi:putative Ig domain-containing protein [Chloroflexi bacterium TSY]|nr:putative Ig domain-containing protein [Chloroflexi bacterium TSY]